MLQQPLKKKDQLHFNTVKVIFVYTEVRLMEC